MLRLNEHKNADELHFELVQTRQVSAGSLLLLEGPDDEKFWRRRVVRDCELVLANGKGNILRCIDRVDREGPAGALGIVDADVDPLQTLARTSPNLVVTEEHDLEGMLLQSSALDAVLIEYGDRGRIRAFEARHGTSVRTALVERATPFGRLRWLSLRDELGIDFADLRPPRFFPEGWRLDHAELHRVAAAACGLSRAELEDRLARLPVALGWAVCQGHDLLDILHVGLGHELGNKRQDPKLLARHLRQAIQAPELERTRLYRDVRVWETRNPPYRVLPPPPMLAGASQ